MTMSDRLLWALLNLVIFIAYSFPVLTSVVREMRDSDQKDQD